MKIALFDIDDCLLSFDDVFLSYAYNTRGLELRNPQYLRYGRSLGCSKDEATKLVYEFYATDEFKYLEPRPGAQDAVVIEAKRYDKCICNTYRPDWLGELTEWQINRFFPQIRDIYYANGFNNHNNPSKEEYAARMNAAKVYDDNHNLCEKLCCSGMNATVLSMRWNEHVPEAKNWYQVMLESSTRLSTKPL